jgi:hypothetical protein
MCRIVGAAVAVVVAGVLDLVVVGDDPEVVVADLRAAIELPGHDLAADVTAMTVAAGERAGTGTQELLIKSHLFANSVELNGTSLRPRIRPVMG